MRKLTNETALITGGTSGIGLKLAEKFLAEGCHVAICSRNQQNVTNAVQKFESQYGDHIMGIACDVTDGKALHATVNQVVAKFGSLRILVANAGINLKYGPFKHYTTDSMYEDAQKIFGVNLLGVMTTISTVLPQMRKQKYGRIITLSGGGADRPLSNMTLYSASKGGAVAFSKCFAAELEEDLKLKIHDIRLNIYQPGMLKTNLIKDFDVVDGWDNKEKATRDADLALELLGGDIDKSTTKVIPYVMPSCQKNGKVFLGFSLFKMIMGAMKLQKIMKENSKSS
ncbi:MAG: SDR family oxidoreductase [Promethearchaeota archaeon]